MASSSLVTIGSPDRLYGRVPRPSVDTGKTPNLGAPEAVVSGQLSVASCQRRQPQILRLGRRGDLTQDDKEQLSVASSQLSVASQNADLSRAEAWCPRLDYFTSE